MLLGVLTVVLVVALVGGVLAMRPDDADVTVTGPADGAVLGSDAAADLRFVVTPGRGVSADRVTVTVDGEAVRARADGRSLVVRPRGLADGRHVLAVRVAASGAFGDPGAARRTFSVDTTPPALDLPGAMTAPSLRGDFQVSGTARDATAVTVNGVDASLDGDRFTAELPAPPATVEVVARDAAGNTDRAQAQVTVRHPGMRAVHVTALGWTAASLREPILQLAREGRIDAVQLDIKDESGHVGYASKVPMARRLGAAKGHYDARRVIDQLHGMGVRVVGRIVAFRDPVLGRWAWRHGHRDWVVQTRDGKPYGGQSYGAYSFTNPYSAPVRRYNIDLATEAAELGFDDILYDYVRRPDGALSGFRFAGADGTPEQAIVRFVKESREAVRAAGAFLGASVYGIAATRPTQIAQDIPVIARYVDYVSPMVYPSHWGRGEYGVRHPNRMPYAIVRRSLADFGRLVEGTNAQIIPWLQDFSLGVEYGPREVAAQIRAARDNGMESFLLWNASARYTRAALEPRRAGAG